MRVIKYKVWDKELKIMVRVTKLESVISDDDLFNDVSYVDDDGNEDEVAMSDCILLQYTGIKDKNGRDIYEGDIYHQGDKNILYVVVWNDTGLTGKQVQASSYAGLSYWKERIEVVGNIYENPELLGD